VLYSADLEYLSKWLRISSLPSRPLILPSARRWRSLDRTFGYGPRK
jgi:hypothetical protein